MNSSLRIASLSVLLVCGLNGQASPTFEVASVKPFDRTGQAGHGSIAIAGPRVTMTGYTLSGLILYAWDMHNYQLSGGPGWMASDAYLIAAKAEGDDAPEVAKVREMLQALLAERFLVKVHRETKQTNVYLLLSAGAGPKLTPSIAAKATMHMSDGHLGVVKMTTTRMAYILSGLLSRPVLDQTGVAGDYDFTIDSPDINMGRMLPLEEISGPSIFTAIQEQRGLKLEPSKGPIEMLVVDRAVKPTGN